MYGLSFHAHRVSVGPGRIDPGHTQRGRVDLIPVGLIGYGYWGPNLLRNLMANSEFEVAAIADGDDARRDAASRQCPSALALSSGDEIIARGDVDAVVIATPVASHFPLVKAALDSGKHVLVEKPMCSTVAEGEERVCGRSPGPATLNNCMPWRPRGPCFRQPPCGCKA